MPKPNGEPTHLFVNCKWQLNERLKRTCSVLESAAEQSEWKLFYQAETMFVSALCPSISQCFLLCDMSCISLLVLRGCHYRLALHSWLLINGTAIPLRIMFTSVDIDRVSTDYRLLYRPIDRSTLPTVNKILHGQSANNKHRLCIVQQLPHFAPQQTQEQNR